MSDTPIYDNVSQPTPIGDKVAQDQQVAKNIIAANLDAVKPTIADWDVKERNNFMAQYNAINNSVTPFWLPYAKAVVAAILGFLMAFLSALLPFLVEGHPVSAVGWVTATISGIVALGASAGIVYATPNVSKK